MSDRDDNLRQAILGAMDDVLPYDFDGHVTAYGTDGYEQISPQDIADAILTAVNNVLDQHSTVQYAARCVNPHCDHTDGPAGIFHVRQEPGPVTDFITMSDRPHLFELVCRRHWIEAWGAVTS